MQDIKSRGFEIKALGEVAIRCKDLTVMTAFYEDILGLKRIRGNQSSGIIFYKIAEGYAGHTTVLALFSEVLDESSTRQTVYSNHSTTLHHLALTISFSEQEAAMKWYERNNIEFEVELFGWVGWRGIFTNDPEGNTVELVAFDSALLS